MWVIMAITSAFLASLVAIFGKLGLKGIDTVMATTLRSLVMAGFLLPLSLLLGRLSSTKLAEVGARDWWLIVASGLAGALSWLAYFAALKAGPASAVAALDRLSILFVLLLAVLFLGESFTWRAGMGAFLVLIGAILMTWK